MKITSLKNDICRAIRQKPKNAYIAILILVFVLFTAGGAGANPIQGSASVGVSVAGGCLSCHADPRISALPGARQGLFVDQSILGSSIHRNVSCTGCHINFNPLTASQNHGPVTMYFRTIAGLSCVSCHQHVEKLEHYSQSAHGRPMPGDNSRPAASCTDCHGSHGIGSFTKDENYRKSYQMAAIEICGRCHPDRAASYDDYYHGLAYKAKTEDAPACWDCHGSHDTLGADEANSSVSPARIASTCGKCHEDARAEYANQYRKLIHGRKQLLESSLLGSYTSKLVSLLGSAIDRLSGYYHVFMGSIRFESKSS